MSSPDVFLYAPRDSFDDADLSSKSIEFLSQLMETLKRKNKGQLKLPDDNLRVCRAHSVTLKLLK